MDTLYNPAPGHPGISQILLNLREKGGRYRSGVWKSDAKMMEADHEALCGPKGRHDPGRQAYRAGSVPSRVTLGGRQIEWPRVRARGAGGERALSSFLWAAGRDPLDAHTLKGVAAGISTRRYRASLDPLPAGLAEYATSFVMCCSKILLPVAL